MSDFGDLGKELENLLRLRTRIIGFKRFLREEDLESIPDIQIMKHYSYFCQLVTYCRTGSVPVGASSKNITPSCATVVGLMEVHQKEKTECLWQDLGNNKRRCPKKDGLDSKNTS